MGKILGITFVCASFICLYNKIKRYFKKRQKQALLEQAQLKKQREYLDKLKTYSAIKNFSICLTLDYRVKRDFSADNKKIINKIIYKKIIQSLSKKFINLKLNEEENSLIIISNDFIMYDAIYESLLKLLSKIKSEVDNRYEIFMIPNITTDAHIKMPDIQKIKRNHNNIKHCNLTNMSCSTNLFLKKYKYLNKNKYSGIPIGEYSILDDETNIYELNMINKDLSKQLESLGR